MSDFWKTVSRDIHEANASSLANTTFRDYVANIEGGVIRKVLLVTGDREFPDDLREAILGDIAVHSLDRRWMDPPSPLREPEWNPGEVEWLAQTGYSNLIERLIKHFRSLADRRLSHRFGGVFTEDPLAFLEARDAATGGAS